MISRRKKILQLLIPLATIAIWSPPITVNSFSSGHIHTKSRSLPSTKLDESPPDQPFKDFRGQKPQSFLDEERIKDVSRRRALQTLFITTAATAVSTTPAFAGKPEYDKVTGELYTPKAEMLAGGSTAARGTGLTPSTSRNKLQPGQAVQTVYDTRFITYLSRFLLTFDPAANAWWVQNVGLLETWDVEGIGSSNSFRQGLTREEVDAKFAEFAESVEIGLADYFVGPYGSYGSVTAAAAGLSASQQVRSSRPSTEVTTNDRSPKILLGLFGNAVESVLKGKSQKEAKTKDRDAIAKQGVLNLYTLLKARYTSVAAKRQLAILFSFFSDSNLQPTAEIHALLGEADNATVSRIDLVRPFPSNEATSRTSSRRGGGYSLAEPPIITIDPPPALGSSYLTAKAKAVMMPTSRVLRIRVIDGGEGYTTPPEVTVSASGSQRVCSACAIVDRDGRVDEVIVLDPGFGYGTVQTRRKQIDPPKVTIAPPSDTEGVRRRAVAVAELEYEIVGVAIVDGGNGYVNTEPPLITISEPSEDPDWFVDVPELRVLLSEFGPVRAEVAEMRGPSGNLAYSIGDYPKPIRSSFSVDRILRDPTELLSSSIRPERNSLGVYIIPFIAAIPTFSSSPNPRYRAVDPLFGNIGRVPVTKSALELKPSEYGRLALSGAVCTVLVRTALNPLELIKTKLQLKNDKELLSFAQKRAKAAAIAVNATNLKIENVTASKSNGVTDTKAVVEEDFPIGALDLIRALVELRGPLSLFQSADITFLASLVFGSFGFGATELFRRSFTIVFFNEGGTGSNSELVLLLAATVATVITSFFAAPFELLRVRSMGQIEQKKWPEVLGDFLQEKSNGGNDKGRNKSKNKRPNQKEKESNTVAAFSLKDLQPQDVVPLWASFPPTVSRELAFAIPKFLAFDILAKAITGFFNAQAGPGSLPIQVGVGSAGLAISAVAGALAGIAGAFVSHPADLILTYISASSKTKKSQDGTGSSSKDDAAAAAAAADWRAVVKDLLSREGGIKNLFVGLPPRLVFFFLVIGLQFFLYDYVKNLLNVGSDDLSLVLDVFYAVRQGLLDSL